VTLIFFVLGRLGLLATRVALWRSQAAPRLYVLIVLVGFVFDVIGRPLEGHLLLFVGASYLAVTVLTPAGSRAPGDELRPPGRSDQA
jgi:hypothetical protein